MNTMSTIETGTHFMAAGTALLPGLPGKFTGPPRTLSEAIQAAVDAIEDAALKPVSPDATSPVSQARTMLALLVNCYVHQVYSSESAATLAARDPDFPWLWWEDFPDARALRRFRAENHAALHDCLTAVLQWLAEQKKIAGELTKINGPQLAQEASRRITMAAFADSVELEGK